MYGDNICIQIIYSGPVNQFFYSLFFCDTIEYHACEIDVDYPSSIKVSIATRRLKIQGKRPEGAQKISQNILSLSLTSKVWMNVPTSCWPPPLGKTGKQALCKTEKMRSFPTQVAYEGWQVCGIVPPPHFWRQWCNCCYLSPSAVNPQCGQMQVTVSISSRPRWSNNILAFTKTFPQVL